MKRIRATRGLYVDTRVQSESDAEMVELLRAVKGPRENVFHSLDRIARACVAPEPQRAAEAKALREFVESLRKRWQQLPHDAPWHAIDDAMLLGAAFEQLRTNAVFEKPARAGLGTMKGGRRNAGDHSRLVAYARERLKAGAKARSLVRLARDARVTTLTDRQARTVLQLAGILPPARKRK